MQNFLRTPLLLSFGLVAALSLAQDAKAQTYGRPYSNNDVRYGNFGRIVTLEGVVTKDSTDNRFQVRAGGRTFDVKTSGNYTVRGGDRVVLRGSFENNNDFKAQTVEIFGAGRDWPRNNWPTNDYRSGDENYIRFSGTVTRVFARDELEVRADSGLVYRVEFRNDVRSIQVGTRLQVSGQSRNGQIFNATLDNLIQPGYGDGYAGGYSSGGWQGNGDWARPQSVDFAGYIRSVERGREQAVVRANNGRDYVIRGQKADKFREGDRVRVRGTARYGFIELRDLDRIR